MTQAEDAEAALIESVCERVRERIAARGRRAGRGVRAPVLRRAPAEDLLERDTLDLYGAALAHWSFARRRRPGEPTRARLQPELRAARLAVDAHRGRDRHRRHAVPRRLGRAWSSTGSELRHPPDRPPGRARPARRGRRARGGRRRTTPSRRRASSRVVHPRRGRPPDRAAPSSRRSRESLRHVLGEVRAAVEDWPRDARARARADRRARASRRRRSTRTRSTRRSALLAWLDGRPLHVPRLPRVRARRRTTARTSCARSRAPGSASCATRRDGARAASRKLPAARARARPRAATLLMLTKANSRSTVHRPAYLDYVGVKRFDADGEVVGERRFLGLYTTAAYRSAPARHPASCAARWRRCSSAPAFPPGSHDEKALLEILETLPARRAVPDRRGRAVRDRDGHPRPRRAPARAAVRAPRPLRALPLVPRLPAARPLQHAEPRAHPARSCARRFRARASTSSCGCRSRCSCASTSSCASPPGELPGVRRGADRGADRRGDARRGATTLARRARRGARRGGGHRAVPPLRRARSRPPTATTGSRARRSPTCGASRSSPTTTRSGMQPLPPARGAAPARCAASSSAAASASRCPTCCRCSRAWASRSLDERPYEVAPRDGAAGVDLRLRPARRRRRRRRRRRDPRALPGRVRARLARRGRERRLQRA